MSGLRWPAKAKAWDTRHRHSGGRIKHDGYTPAEKLALEIRRSQLKRDCLRRLGLRP